MQQICKEKLVNAETIPPKSFQTEGHGYCHMCLVLLLNNFHIFNWNLFFLFHCNSKSFILKRILVKSAHKEVLNLIMHEIERKSSRLLCKALTSSLHFVKSVA